MTDKGARKLYRTFAKELTRFGLLTNVDTQELARACDMWVAGMRLWETYKAEPFVKSRGFIAINPAFNASLAAFEAARKIFLGFGVGSPAERSRLKVAQPEKKSRWNGLVR